MDLKRGDHSLVFSFGDMDIDQRFDNRPIRYVSKEPMGGVSELAAPFS